MKKILFMALAASLFACNNNKKEDKPADHSGQTTTATTPSENTGTTPAATDDNNSNTLVTVEGKELKLRGSILVDKDKKNMQPGAPYRAMITTSNGPGDETVVLRFVFDTKPGSYPLTGMSYMRGKDDNNQMFGGLMGGEEKIYDAKVTLTEAKDLGDNGTGGHKWSISGSVENLTIPAMKLMLMDKSKNHPAEVKIDKVTFSGLVFDDNAEEMLKKALEMIKKPK